MTARPPVTIEQLDAGASQGAAEALADVLIDCVEGGASVSFMFPLPRAKAVAFWQGVAERVSRGEVMLLCARDADGICGTVQLQTALPENQPHRADVAKLLVHRRARERGVGEALMREIEAAAIAAGTSLLVLDTASAAADRLYRRLGWTECGTIPNFALNPDGTPCATTVFWKQLSASPA